MTKTNAWRPIPLSLTMLIALFSALAALALSGGHDASAHEATVDRPAAVSTRELALRNDMRRL